MPKLEILSRRPAGPAKPVPLLFVHGAFCAGWIWDEHFLPWFAEQGWEAHAVSLRGHGASAGRERLNSFGIADYVDDVLSAVESCSTPPVLIGHSMGGMVVQRALARRRFPGAVLMASAPPHGLLESSLRLAWSDPYVFQQMGRLMTFANGIEAEAVRRAMFSDRVPLELAKRYEPLMQEESQRVLLDIGGWIPFPLLPARGARVAVLGAEEDRLIPKDQVEATARAFRTEPVFFPEMGHSMMLEPGWEAVARHVAGWVETTVLGKPAQEKTAPKPATPKTAAPDSGIRAAAD
ncbi:alpha-beta hydrolase superfamily lysophospholipase [Azospirillum brasilense]|uniref:Alpha-beta hydrolase superfamily lysophospholipase n=1 Tax=Azospirillum brasilense TaxID=192 RepID=A0A560CCS1_AZOBR|nr:alpha/beta hydrolase [Azospirillum brasilense]TWA82658.1 alpha-beta hydrolase superfamily lysophospholipase [Azospirillum brasilense]